MKNNILYISRLCKKLNAHGECGRLGPGCNCRCHEPVNLTPPPSLSRKTNTKS